MPVPVQSSGVVIGQEGSAAGARVTMASAGVIIVSGDRVITLVAMVKGPNMARGGDE